MNNIFMELIILFGKKLLLEAIGIDYLINYMSPWQWPGFGCFWLLIFSLNYATEFLFSALYFLCTLITLIYEYINHFNIQYSNGPKTLSNKGLNFGKSRLFCGEIALIAGSQHIYYHIRVSSFVAEEMASFCRGNGVLFRFKMSFFPSTKSFVLVISAKYSEHKL